MSQINPITLYAPPDQYQRAALNLEESVRCQLRPFQTRLVLALFVSTVLTIAMGLLGYAILVGSLDWPPLVSIFVATLLQITAVIAFHAWFHALHLGERTKTWKKWTWFAIAVTLSLIMAGLGGFRAYQYLSDLDWNLFLLGLGVLLFAVIEPTFSCVAGFCTAAATHALEMPQDTMKRATDHKKRVVTTPDSASWQESIDQVEQERHMIIAENAENSQQLEWQAERVKHLDEWIKQLRGYNPGRPVTQSSGEGSTPPVIHVSGTTGLKMAG